MKIVIVVSRIAEFGVDGYAAFTGCASVIVESSAIPQVVVGDHKAGTSSRYPIPDGVCHNVVAYRCTRAHFAADTARIAANGIVIDDCSSSCDTKATGFILGRVGHDQVAKHPG